MPYKMKEKEKISEIVERYDIPLSQIQRYNPFVEKLNGEYPGKTLTFPRVYVALPGDSYTSISKEYNIMPLYLKELNPYADGPSVIYPGQTIFLPPSD